MLTFELKNGQTFFFLNKDSSHAKMGLTPEKKLIGCEGNFSVDQLWYIEGEPKKPGSYYIVNAHHNLNRLYKPHEKNASVGVYYGKYIYDDQLWTFVKKRCLLLPYLQLPLQEKPD